MPTWKEEMEMPPWKKGFYKAIAEMIEKETSHKEVEIYDVDDPVHTHGCDTCDYGGQYTIDIRYKHHDSSFEFYTFRGNFSDLINELTDSEI